METLYRVSDFSGSTINLLADNSNDFKAKSNIDAAKKYLKKQGIKAKPVRSGANHVEIKVEPFYVSEDGKKYYHPRKKVSWYELKREEN